MKISINVKIYSIVEYVFGDLSKSVLRSLVADVTKVETVNSVEFGYALRVLNVIHPICMMFKTFLSSSQYLALLETISYTVRESIIRSQNWFHSTDYENFQICIETEINED